VYLKGSTADFGDNEVNQVVIKPDRDFLFLADCYEDVCRTTGFDFGEIVDISLFRNEIPGTPFTISSE